jgi:hypothetical protein
VVIFQFLVSQFNLFEDVWKCLKLNLVRYYGDLRLTIWYIAVLQFHTHQGSASLTNTCY